MSDAYRHLLFAAVVVCVTGCKVGPNYRPPAPNAPARWSGATTATDQASAISEDPAEITRWWTVFSDPKLDSLIDRAIESNFDLHLAESRVRQARAQRGVVAAEFFPNADVSADYTRSRSSGSVGTVKTNPPQRSLFRAGLDASWELDLFGGVRRNIEAASADIGGSVEDLRDVRVTLVSEVALNYIELRGLQQRLAVARQNLESQRHTVDVTRQKLAAGVGAGLAVANAEGQVATTESQIPVLEGQIRQTIRNIALLLALHPAALDEELSAQASIPAIPPRVGAGLPSDILRRRPDIRRAERQLAAATSRIGVATADLFPRFSLTGSLGLESAKLNDLGSWNSRYWSLGPTATWPIFDAGRIRSNIKVQNELERQAFTQYQKTVLTAFTDVENAMVAYSQEQAHRKALAAAVTANRRAVEISNRLYNQGLTDFLNVLDAQRQLLSTEDALAQSEQAVSTDLVALYKALGGGWETDLDIAK